MNEDVEEYFRSWVVHCMKLHSSGQRNIGTRQNKCQKRPIEESKLENQAKMIKSTHNTTLTGHPTVLTSSLIKDNSRTEVKQLTQQKIVPQDLTKIVVGNQPNGKLPSQLNTSTFSNYSMPGTNVSRAAIPMVTCKSVDAQAFATSRPTSLYTLPRKISPVSNEINQTFVKSNENNGFRNSVQQDRKTPLGHTPFGFIEKMANQAILKKCSLSDRSNENGTLEKMTAKFFQDQMMLLKSNNDVLLSGKISY